MIYFKNKKESRAKGLEGVIYIDQQNYAIAKAVMHIKGVLDISGTHEFEYLEAENIWFPSSKTFKIVKGKNDDDIKILGLSEINFSFVLPLLCFILISIYGFKQKRN